MKVTQNLVTVDKISSLYNTRRLLMNFTSAQKCITAICVNFI